MLWDPRAMTGPRHPGKKGGPGTPGPEGGSYQLEAQKEAPKPPSWQGAYRRGEDSVGEADVIIMGEDR